MIRLSFLTLMLTGFLLGSLPCILHSESDVCFVYYAHDRNPLTGNYLLSGNVQIDYGKGKPVETKYDSVAKLLLDMLEKGYELKQVYSAVTPNNFLNSFFIFYKKK